jgi:hypothetical protein
MMSARLRNTELASQWAAQIVPNPLGRIELRAVRRQRQQSDIAEYYQALAPVPTGTIEDHHGMGKACPRERQGDLTADPQA